MLLSQFEQTYIGAKNSLEIVDAWYSGYQGDSISFDYMNQFSQSRLKIKRLCAEVESNLTQLKANLNETPNLFKRFWLVYWSEPWWLRRLYQEAVLIHVQLQNSLETSVETAFTKLAQIISEILQRAEKFKNEGEEINQIVARLDQAPVTGEDAEKIRKNLGYLVSKIKDLHVNLLDISPANIRSQIRENRELALKINNAQKILNENEAWLSEFLNCCKGIDALLSSVNKILADLAASVVSKRLTAITDSTQWPASLAQPYAAKLETLRQEAYLLIQPYQPLIISELKQFVSVVPKPAYHIIERANALIDVVSKVNQDHQQLRIKLDKMQEIVGEAEKKIQQAEKDVAFLTDLPDVRICIESLRKRTDVQTAQYKSLTRDQLYNLPADIYKIPQEAAEIVELLSLAIEQGLESQRHLRQLVNAVDRNRFLTESKRLPEPLTKSFEVELDSLRSKVSDFHNEFAQLSTTASLALNHQGFIQRVKDFYQQITNIFWGTITQVKTNYEELERLFLETQQASDKTT
jgi:hypothetical protein